MEQDKARRWNRIEARSHLPGFLISFSSVADPAMRSVSPLVVDIAAASNLSQRSHESKIR